MSSSERVIIFDTTLRDGEQSPGASMNLGEKLRIAATLEAMGVDVIEAGFPAASQGDFDAVRAIAEVVKGSVVAGLARARRADIERCAGAVQPAERRRIHTFISTSALHMKHKLNMTPEQVVEAIADSVSFARLYTDDVEWSAEDGSRTDPDFLCRCVETAIKAGATTINIPDTVGYAIPTEFAAMIESLRGRVPNMDRAVLSVHCHNDLGLAVANSLAGVVAGARQIECTINGMGERAGNAALEEVVMALRTRADLLPYTTGIRAEAITQASRLVSTITGFNVQPNKAIVGKNAFAHESGIHQDGMLKHPGTYEIMTPESVGRTSSTLVMGKHSGRAAFRSKLQDLGHVVEGEALERAFARFKDLADRKKDVFDEDINALIEDQEDRTQEHIRLESLTVHAGSRGPQDAAVEIVIDGTLHAATATGSGPVDATFNAIRAICPHTATLALFQIESVTGGTDAQARATVRLELNGRTVNGHGANVDTLVASAMAYIHAVSKLNLVPVTEPVPAAVA